MKIKILLVVLFQVLISLNCIAQVADFEVEMKSNSNSKLELKIKNNTSEYASIFNGIHRIDERSYLKIEYKNNLNEIIYSEILSIGEERLVVIPKKEIWTHTYCLHSDLFDISTSSKMHLTLVLDYFITDGKGKRFIKTSELPYFK